MNWVFEKEKIVSQEAEKILSELTAGYIEDGISEDKTRIMVLSDLREDYD